MKTRKRTILAAILVALAFTALSLAGCDTGGGGGTDPFEGTWIGTSGNVTSKFVAKNGSFTSYTNDNLIAKGTYTVSGNTVTLTFTHSYNNGGWQEFNAIDTGTISGSTFTYGNDNLTKQ
jgi:predicted small secreted protein